MPLCDLTCPACKHKQEHLLKKVPEPDVPVADTTCEKCGEGPMARDDSPQKTSFELRGRWFANGGY